MEFRDYYEILGVKRDAAGDEIKRAYRKLARKYHPDVSKEKDAEVRFKEVGEAYEVLKNPEKRAAYDQLGANWQAGEDFRPPPDWNQGFEFHGGEFSGADAQQFSDFFESLFGGGGLGSGFASQKTGNFHGRGEDTHARLLIDVEDSYKGATRALVLKHTEIDAEGRPLLKERTFNVRIPKGVHQGQHIRLAQQGSPGIGKGEPGDLYLEVEFRTHPFYHVEGRDVFLDLPVAPWEAALGTRVKVPTPSGVVDLVIPENAAGGKKLRLRGRGIPAATPGDLYAILQIALPPADTQVRKDAYQVLEQAGSFNPRSRLGV